MTRAIVHGALGVARGSMSTTITMFDVWYNFVCQLLHQLLLTSFPYSPSGWASSAESAAAPSPPSHCPSSDVLLVPRLSSSVLSVVVLPSHSPWLCDLTPALVSSPTANSVQLGRLSSTLTQCQYRHSLCIDSHSLSSLPCCAACTALLWMCQATGHCVSCP